MLAHPISNASILDRFVGRENELGHFRQVLELPTGEEMPTFGYHGAPGVGKTWLLRHFMHLAEQRDVPAYALDINLPSLGDRVPDAAGLCMALVDAFGIDAPRTLWAIAFILRAEQPYLLLPGLKEDPASYRRLFEEPILNALYGTLFEPHWSAFGRQTDALNRYLATAEGTEDLGWLANVEGVWEIRKTLFRRLGQDLRDHPNLPRAGHAVQAVVLVDAAEGSFFPHAEEGEKLEAIAWMRDLMRGGPAGDSETGILVVPFSEKPLPSDSPFQGTAIGGFSVEVATAYLQARQVPETTFSDILTISSDFEGDPLHHPATLALAAETALLNPSADIAFALDPIPRRYINLFRLYLTLAGSDEADREPSLARQREAANHPAARKLKLLGLTPTWDATAFAWAFEIEGDPARQSAELARVAELSFVGRTPDGRFYLHPLAQSASHVWFSGYDLQEMKRRWAIYWAERTRKTNDFAELQLWAHVLELEPATVAEKYRQVADQANASGDVSPLVRFIAVNVTLLAVSPIRPSLHAFVANQLRTVTIGNHDRFVRIAIGAHLVAIREPDGVSTEDRADAYQFVAIGYHLLRSGNRQEKPNSRDCRRPNGPSLLRCEVLR